jgi:hypothetical protein
MNRMPLAVVLYALGSVIAALVVAWPGLSLASVKYVDTERATRLVEFVVCRPWPD